MKLTSTSLLSFAILALATACGSTVSSVGAGGGGGGGGGGGKIDQDCFEQCIAKGTSTEGCEQACYDPNTSVGAGKATSVGAGGSSSLDEAAEKQCIECWYEQAETNGTCAAEVEACEASLACEQLQWCPILCGKPNCIEECNEVIPSGVEPLTAVVQCAACDGGPCASECAGSILLSYCK